jgi:hypothetical protein
MDSVDYNTLYDLGQKRGGCRNSHIQPGSDDLLILDFGQPRGPDAVYIWGSNPVKKITDIEYGIEGFISGYHDCTYGTQTFLLLGVGLNNYDENGLWDGCFKENGREWGQMVTHLNTFIHNYGFGNNISVAGAMDIEPGFGQAWPTQDWVAGFDAGAPNTLFFDFGTCNDCGSKYQAPGFVNGWTHSLIYSVASGTSLRYPIPQIYNTMWSNALQWQNLNQYMMQNFYTAPMIFWGVMTQQTACIENDIGANNGPHCDATIKNSPAEGWQQLQQVLASDPQTQNTAVLNLYLTDISWTR